MMPKSRRVESFTRAVSHVNRIARPRLFWSGVGVVSGGSKIWAARMDRASANTIAATRNLRYRLRAVPAFRTDERPIRHLSQRPLPAPVEILRRGPRPCRSACARSLELHLHRPRIAATDDDSAVPGSRLTTRTVSPSLGGENS